MKRIQIKAWRQDGLSFRPDGKKTWKLWKRPRVRTGYQSVLTGSRMGSTGKWPGVRTGGYRPDLHKKSPVRKAVLTRFLTVRELEKLHFAYSSGRDEYRPDGTSKVERVRTDTEPVLTE